MEDEDDYDFLLQLAEEVEARGGAAGAGSTAATEDDPHHPQLPSLLRRDDEDAQLEAVYGKEEMRRIMSADNGSRAPHGGSASMGDGGQAAAAAARPVHQAHGGSFVRCAAPAAGAGSSAAAAVPHAPCFYRGPSLVPAATTGTQPPVPPPAPAPSSSRPATTPSGPASSAGGALNLAGHRGSTVQEGGTWKHGGTQGPQAALAGYTEQMSGLRVTRPVVGSLVVRDRLSDGAFVKLGSLSKGLPDLAGSWATVAILANKSIAESRTGTSYSRWQVTDFASTTTLFLFGQAHSELSKEAEGSIFILLNPKLSKDASASSSSQRAFSLTVDKAQQLQRIGASPDLGLCSSTKKDGSRCGMPVNRSECDVCIYHAQAALKRLSTTGNRPELAQGGKSYVTKTLQKVALKGPDLLRPPPKAARAQRDGSASQLEERVANLADKGGKKVTDKNSFRMMMAVVQQKRKQEEQEEERAAREEAAGPKRPRRKAPGVEDDEGGEGMDQMMAREEREAASEGKYAAARAKAAQHMRGVREAKQREQEQRQRQQQEQQQRQQRSQQQEGRAGPRQGAGSQEDFGAEDMDVDGPREQPRRQGQGQQRDQGWQQQQAQQRPAQVQEQQQRQQQGQQGQRQGQQPERQQALQQQGQDADDLEILPDQPTGPEDDDLEIVAAEEEGQEGQGMCGVGAATAAAAAVPLVPSTGLQTNEPASTACLQSQGADGRAAPAAAASAAALSARPVLQCSQALNLETSAGPSSSSRGPSAAPSSAPRPAVPAAKPASAATAARAASAAAGLHAAPSSAVRPQGTAAVPQQGPHGARGLSAVLPREFGTGAGANNRASKQSAAAASKSHDKLMSDLRIRKDHPLAPGALAAAGPGPTTAAATAPATVAASGSYRSSGGGSRQVTTTGAPRQQQQQQQRQQGLSQRPGAPPMQAVGSSRAAAAAAASGGGRSAMQAAFGALASTVPAEESGSRYADLVNDAEFDALEQMMEEAERKDALATKLDNVTKLDVQAWHCPQCQRMSEFFDPGCKGHGATRVRTTKRFWNCGHCNFYFTTLGVIHPKKRCPKCTHHGMDFKPATMYRGPKGSSKPDAGSGLAQRQNFLARGVEHGFSLKG